MAAVTTTGGSIVGVATTDIVDLQFGNGAELTGTGVMSKIATGADTQCVAGHGYAAVAAGKDIDLRGYHSDGGSANLTVSHCNLTVTRIGN